MTYDEDDIKRANIKTTALKANAAIAALVSLLANNPDLIPAYREAKAAEQTIEWVRLWLLGKEK
jgi:hypothetical protein